MTLSDETNTMSGGGRVLPDPPPPPPPPPPPSPARVGAMSSTSARAEAALTGRSSSYVRAWSTAAALCTTAATRSRRSATRSARDRPRSSRARSAANTRSRPCRAPPSPPPRSAGDASTRSIGPRASTATVAQGRGWVVASSAASNCGPSAPVAPVSSTHGLSSPSPPPSPSSPSPSLSLHAGAMAAAAAAAEVATPTAEVSRSQKASAAVRCAWLRETPSPSPPSSLSSPPPPPAGKPDAPGAVTAVGPRRACARCQVVRKQARGCKGL